MSNQEILNNLNDLFGVRSDSIAFFLPFRETAKDILTEAQYLYFMSLLSRYENRR